MSVNLPRWGLKPDMQRRKFATARGVNLPRWGLKLVFLKNLLKPVGVNLPRWGLKLELENGQILAKAGVNLPRWGLKLKSRLVKAVYRRV